MSGKDHNQFVKELKVNNCGHWSYEKEQTAIKDFFIQYLFNVSNLQYAHHPKNRTTTIYAKSDFHSYRFEIICNSKGSITISLHHIDSPSKMERLIELDWKVGDWDGLRQNITNKSFIEYGSDGFIYKIFIPTLEHLEITFLKLCSS